MPDIIQWLRVYHIVVRTRLRCRAATSPLGRVWMEGVIALIAALALGVLVLNSAFPAGTPHSKAGVVAQATWFRQTTCGASLHATGVVRTVAYSPRRAVASACGNAPDDSVVFIALMRSSEARHWDAEMQKSRRQTWEWLVTVHADQRTEGGVFGPQLKHVFSLSINATTGQYDDYCIGCATLG